MALEPADWEVPVENTLTDADRLIIAKFQADHKAAERESLELRLEVVKAQVKEIEERLASLDCPAPEPVEEPVVAEQPAVEPEADSSADDTSAEASGSEVVVEKPTKAGDVVAAIEKAESVEAVDALADGDSRPSVVAAAKKRVSELDA